MIRKYYYGDVSRMVDDMFRGFESFPFISDLSFKGQLVNTDDYDIIPKRSKIERELKEKEQALQEFKERQKNHKRWADEQEKALGIEIDQLKQKLAP